MWYKYYPVEKLTETVKRNKLGIQLMCRWDN